MLAARECRRRERGLNLLGRHCGCGVMLWVCSNAAGYKPFSFTYSAPNYYVYHNVFRYIMPVILSLLPPPPPQHYHQGFPHSPPPAGADLGAGPLCCEPKHSRLCLAVHHLQLSAGTLGGALLFAIACWVRCRVR